MPNILILGGGAAGLAAGLAAAPEGSYSPENDFVPVQKVLAMTPQEFFDEGNPYPETLKEFIAEAKQLDEKSMAYILGIMKELNSKK